MRVSKNAGSLLRRGTKARFIPSEKGTPAPWRSALLLPVQRSEAASHIPSIAGEIQTLRAAIPRQFDESSVLQSASPPSAQPTTTVSPDLSLLRQHLGIEERTDAIFNSTIPPDPIFVCIDVEAYEFNQDRITEVGIATLDVRDLTPDGLRSPSKWRHKLRTSHYLMQENIRLVNKRFVTGCPDKFHFGQSRVVRIPQMQSILRKTFKIYDFLRKEPQSRRNIVFVGHGIGGDAKYLSKLGFVLQGRAEIIGHVDTDKIAGALGLPQNLRKLALGLGVKAKDLHNAGNDARYTLLCAILMAQYGCTLPVPQVMWDARQAVATRKAELAARREAHNRLQDEMAEMFKGANNCEA